MYHSNFCVLCSSFWRRSRVYSPLLWHTTNTWPKRLVTFTYSAHLPLSHVCYSCLFILFIKRLLFKNLEKLCKFTSLIRKRKGNEIWALTLRLLSVNWKIVYEDKYLDKHANCFLGTKTIACVIEIVSKSATISVNTSGIIDTSLMSFELFEKSKHHCNQNKNVFRFKKA